MPRRDPNPSSPRGRSTRRSAPAKPRSASNRPRTGESNDRRRTSRPPAGRGRPDGPRSGRGRSEGGRESDRRDDRDARAGSRRNAVGTGAGAGRGGRDGGRGRDEGQSRGRGRDQDRSRGQSRGRGRDQDRSREQSRGRGRGEAGDRVEGNPNWGGVARRGARQGVPRGRASEVWREAGGRGGDRDQARPGDPGGEPHRSAPEAWEPEQWIDEGEVRDEAERAVDRGARGGANRSERERGGDRQRPGSPSADDTSLGDELRSAVGPSRATRFEGRVDAAADAFKRGRFEEARKTLRPLAEAAPRSATVRELYGLTLYRLGRWKQAVRELEALRQLTGSLDQHPVLADCYRALGRYHEVEELWEDLKAASPGAALVAEGRIVAAGALADQGRVDDAIALLDPAVRPTRRAREHHLRVAYALADLYERAGDLPRARELFQRVATNDREFVDVQARLRSLG